MPLTTYGSLSLPDTEQDREKVDKYNTAINTLATETYKTIGARVYHNATQSISSGGTAAPLAFNSERYDTDTIHDNSTNNTRLTCKTAGSYLIIGSVLFDVNATGQRLLEIRLNGTTLLADQRTNAIAGGTLGTGLTIATQYPLAVNDYVELLVFQNSGSSLNVLSAGNYTPEFMIVRIGA